MMIYLFFLSNFWLNCQKCCCLVNNWNPMSYLWTGDSKRKETNKHTIN